MSELPMTEKLHELWARQDGYVAEIARLRERIEKLEACVKAADALREKMRKVYQRPAYMGVFDVYRVHGFTYPKDDTDNWIREQDGYDAARAALGEVEREG